ncbi:MAG: mandelate racemase/muconate lactonizing enzyme family protein [Rhizobiaceae bacterium]|nr:mandelate racemase/muconate lactonizing enzyme family protein [Rhizobiaceae bacterium]
MPGLLSPTFADGDLSFTIARAEAIVMRVACAIPVKTSFGTMFDRSAVFVELEDTQGNRGLGEVWCNFPACGAEHRARLLETALFPALIGRTFDSPHQCFAALDAQFARLAIQSGEAGPVAQSLAGMDIALWDLVARRAGLPLYRLLGGDTAKIPTYASGINPAQAAQTVERCRSEGHRAFKLKIGFDRSSDLDNIARISTSLSENEILMVDANQAWSLEEALEIVPDLQAWPLRWLEEPMMATSPPEDWQRLAAATSIPLAAGENMMNAQQFSRAITGNAYGVIQPDLCKWGGISGVLPVARQAIAADKLYCPHYLGGGIGLAASAHLLAAVGGDGLLEIDANENVLRTELFPAMVTDGELTLDDAPGLGLESAFERLKASGIASGAAA